MCFLLVGELYISLARFSSSYLFISFINNGSSQLLTANLLQKSFPQSGQPLSSYHIAEENIIDIPGLQCSILGTDSGIKVLKHQSYKTVALLCICICCEPIVNLTGL